MAEKRFTQDRREYLIYVMTNPLPPSEIPRIKLDLKAILEYGHKTRICIGKFVA